MAPKTAVPGAGAAACPVSPVVDLVFSRWTTPVLWALNESGRLRFVELERDGLVTRHYHPEVPPRVEYEITDLGRSLSPVFAALSQWSDAHLPEVENARARYTGPLPR